VIVVGCLVSGFGGVLFSRTKAVSEGAKEQPATAATTHKLERLTIISAAGSSG
jgi:hypothetical protein